MLLFSIRGSGRSGLRKGPSPSGTQMVPRDIMSRDACPLIQFKVRVKQAQLASLLPKPPSPAPNFAWPVKELLLLPTLASLAARPASRIKPSRSFQRRGPQPSHVPGSQKQLWKAMVLKKRNRNLQPVVRNAVRPRRMKNTHHPLRTGRTPHLLLRRYVTSALYSTHELIT